MIKPQLPHVEDGVLPTVFVHPDQAKRLSHMLELSMEQAAQVAGGGGVSAAVNINRFRLCRIVACRVICRISCMVVTPQVANKAVLGG